MYKELDKIQRNVKVSTNNSGNSEIFWHNIISLMKNITLTIKNNMQKFKYW